MSLRSRIFMLVLAVLLPAVAAYSFNEFRHRQAKMQDLRRDAEQDAVLIATEISRLVSGIEHTLKAISRMPSVRQADAEGCSRYVTDLKVNFNGPSEIGVSDLSGQVFCLSRPIKGINIADRLYFRDAVSSRTLSVGEFAVGRAAGARAIHFGYPVEDLQNQLVGVAFMPVNLDWLSDTLARLPLPPASSVTITDRNGTILVRLPERNLVGQQLPSAWKSLLRSASSATAPLPGLLDASDHVVGYVPLGQGPEGLFVAVGLSHDLGMQPIDSASLQALLLIVLSTVLAFGLASFISDRWVHRPVRALNKTADRLRHGDYTARIEFEASQGPEFESLGTTINEMANSLERSQADAALREQQLATARDQAQAANRSKTSFLAAVSHDLRQPLQSMALTAALLNIRLAGRQELALVARLQRTVTDLSELLNSVLDVSQLDAGMIEPQVDDFSLGTLFQSVTDHFLEEANSKGVSLEIDEPQVWIRSDARLLRRILENLVANAIKYTPKHGSVRLTYSEMEDFVRLQVADDGPGIPLAKQTEIWEEYRQLANPERDVAKGLGLGLAIVQRMAALLQHEISLSSEIGRGTTFTVIVAKSVRHQVLLPSPAAPELQGTVLLVEDDSTVAASTAEILEAWGLVVIVSNNAEGGIDFMRQKGKRIDAVIADYRLPGRSGAEVIQAARSLERPPICILLTGDVGVQVDLKASSDVLVLSKPLSTATLSSALNPLRRRSNQQIDDVAPRPAVE